MNALGLLFLMLFAQQPAASIEGTVVQTGNAQPVARAVVEIDNGREVSAAATGADGKFAFRNLASGQYRIRVSRSGYLESAYGKRGPNGQGRALAVSAGQSVKDVRITLIPGGAISGRIYDSVGEPLANATVRALKYNYSDGQRTLTQVREDTSDDRGEYRLFWLPPGDYYVSAVAQGAGPDEAFHMMLEGQRLMRTESEGRTPTGFGTGIEKLGEKYVPLYYPGTADVQAATPLEVRPGADFGGVDFSLTRVSQRKVRGVVIDGATGQTVRGAAVTLVPRIASIAGQTFGRPSSDGTFEIHGVLPGSYFAAATGRIPAGGDSFRLVGGRAAVDVSNADLDRVVVVMSPTVDIAGQVIVEGTGAVVDENDHPTVTLKNELAGVSGRLSQIYGSFQGGRRFVINDAVEGEYQVQLTGLPQGTYVKSIRFGSADVLNNTLRLDSGSRDRLEIVLATNAGALEGTVAERNRAPLANAPVAIVPYGGQRQRADLYRNASTDEAGRFQIRGIPPGDYLIFAWEDIEEGRWRDPEFIRRNEAAGKPVRIIELGRESVELTAIPYGF